jgi:hypothetical protein
MPRATSSSPIKRTGCTRQKDQSLRRAEYLHKFIVSNQDIEYAMDGLSRKDVQMPEISDDAIMNLFQKSTMQMLSLIKNDKNLIQRFHEVESLNKTSQDNDDDEKESMPCHAYRILLCCPRLWLYDRVVCIFIFSDKHYHRLA